MIQIDIPMPEACDVCPFNYDFCWCRAFEYHENFEKYSDDWNENVCERTTRPEYCPLKEQEIIHCKDCIHRDPEDHKCDHHWHAYSPLPVDDDFWCAYGERWEKRAVSD